MISSSLASNKCTKHAVFGEIDFIHVRNLLSIDAQGMSLSQVAVSMPIDSSKMDRLHISRSVGVDTARLFYLL